MKNIQMVDLKNFKRFKHSSRRQSVSESKYFTFSNGRGKNCSFFYKFSFIKGHILFVIHYDNIRQRREKR